MLTSNLEYSHNDIKNISNEYDTLINTPIEIKKVCDNGENIISLSDYKKRITKFKKLILYFLKNDKLNNVINIIKNFANTYLSNFKDPTKNICSGWSEQGFSFNNYIYDIAYIYVHIRDNHSDILNDNDKNALNKIFINHYAYTYNDCIEKMKIDNLNLGNCTNANLFERFSGFYMLTLLSKDNKYFFQILTWIIDDMSGNSLKSHIGLMKDYSFHHHENQLYSGHYVNSYTNFLNFFIKNVNFYLNSKLIFLKLIFFNNLYEYFKNHHKYIYSFLNKFLIIDIHTNGRFAEKPFNITKSIEPFSNLLIKEFNTNFF